jgi:hypothetical protein
LSDFLGRRLGCLFAVAVQRIGRLLMGDECPFAGWYFVPFLGVYNLERVLLRLPMT